MRFVKAKIEDNLVVPTPNSATELPQGWSSSPLPPGWSSVPHGTSEKPGFFESGLEQTPIPLASKIIHHPIKAGAAILDAGKRSLTPQPTNARYSPNPIIRMLGKQVDTTEGFARDAAESVRQGEYGAAASDVLQAVPGVGNILTRALEQTGDDSHGYFKNLVSLLQNPGAMGTLTGGAATLAIPGRAALRKVGGGSALEDAAEVAIKPVRTPFRVIAQEAAGAGKEVVAKANRSRNEAVARVEATNAKRQAAAERTNSERLAKEVEDRTKLANDKKTYAQKEFGVRQVERGADAATAQKQVIARAQNEYAKLALDNLRKTKDVAKGALDERWSALRKKMDTPRMKGSAIETHPVKSEPIVDAIKDARQKYLVGSPEDLKVFNDLVGQIESGPLVDNGAGIVRMSRPLGWQEARTYFTTIGDKMYSGTLQGNVWKAMQTVQKALDTQLQSAAESRGLGKEYGSIRRDWGQYKSDFDDLSNMSTGGGSPLARAVRFQNPADMEGLLKGKYGGDLAERAARYRDKGANPKIIDSYRDLSRRAAGIEKPKVPPHPARITRTVEPAKLVRPKLEDLPEDVKPYEIRLHKLEEYAGRPLSIWDAFPPRTIERLMLKSQGLRKWIAAQPRKEITH